MKPQVTCQTEIFVLLCEAFGIFFGINFDDQNEVIFEFEVSFVRDFVSHIFSLENLSVELKLVMGHY